MSENPSPNAESSGSFEIGGEFEVNRLGYGAMRVTGDMVIGEPEDVENSVEVLRKAVKLGVDFIDTADSYGPGVSERLIREALHDGSEDPYDGICVATKGGLLRSPDGEWLRNSDPDYLTNAALCSIDRLGADTIDLYQLHRVDEENTVEESVHALAELKDEGLINQIGLSEVTVEEIERASEVVEVATIQNRYNVADREHEEVLEYCEKHGIGFIPWFPLNAGNLSSHEDDLETVASEHGASVYQAALAWLLERSPVTLPIPGTSSLEHLHENVAAAEFELSSGEMERLKG
ncbi:MAG: aldo/keto reductase [Halobacteria archaeon]